MRLVLLWHNLEGRGEDLDPERVARKLQQIFSPLFSTAPKSTIRQTPAMTMVFLQLPVRGWKPPFFEEDEQTWAVAVEYPIDARPALEANGVHVAQGGFLPTLCRSLQSNPVPLLRDMAPPFSLAWASKQTGETFVQNDGLGQAQLFEYQGSRLWALTNKIFALKAIGVELELEPEDWAARCTLPWFPLDRTGYKRTRFLGPATQVRLHASGVSRTTHDVLADWVSLQALSPADCLEMARTSLLRQIKAAMPLWDKPTAGLTGGWDTRAVVASLRFLGVDFSARVRGQSEHYDVVIASELARRAGFDLRVQAYPGLPPETAEDCRRSIVLALLWQAGYTETGQHKEFLVTRGHLDGFVNIMGQHGEIGRARFATRIQAEKLREEQYEEHLIIKLMEHMPPFMRRSFHERIRHFIREAYRQADRYGLTALARLDFFYLCEGNRRWASGSLNSQPGVVVAPFLNPGYIRATFGYQGRGKETNPFHRHIIATHAPEWINVPDTRDLRKAELRKKKFSPPERSGSEPAVTANWRQPTGRRNYDSLLYWKEVGAPILREALAQGGFWTELFDPGLAEQEWHAAPDHLAIAHLLPRVLQSSSPL